MYPAYADKQVEMRLFCSTLPDSETDGFLEQLRVKLSDYNIGFVVSKLK